VQQAMSFSLTAFAFCGRTLTAAWNSSRETWTWFCAHISRIAARWLSWKHVGELKAVE